MVRGAVGVLVDEFLGFFGCFREGVSVGVGRFLVITLRPHV